MFVLLLFFLVVSCSPNEEQIETTSTSTVLSRGNVPGQPNLFAQLPSIAMGSAIGPGGDLFVTQSGQGGSILRIDKNTGNVTTFASNLPKSVVPIGGVIDVAFRGDTAYALVTLVGSLFGDQNINGIYRIDGTNSYTVIADIGQFAVDNPPSGFEYEIITGLQYAIQPYQDGFLVTDGHLNRVYNVKLDGEITGLKMFDNIVPTGLDVRGNTVYMAEAGLHLIFLKMGRW